MGLLSTGTVGFAIAATGAAHFVAPEAFAGITKAAFPDDTATWVIRNGATETAVGLAMMAPPTRKLGGLRCWVTLAGSATTPPAIPDRCWPAA